MRGRLARFHLAGQTGFRIPGLQSISSSLGAHGSRSLETKTKSLELGFVWMKEVLSASCMHNNAYGIHIVTTRLVPNPCVPPFP